MPHKNPSCKATDNLPEKKLIKTKARIYYVSKKRVRLFVSGKVQGVFFRQSMKDVADENSVKGWVKNRPEGRVEAVLEGEEDAVSRVVQWSHEGPERASVVNVDVQDEEFADEFTDFDIAA